MSALFEPMTLRSLTVPNRIWLAPMCMYSAAAEGPETGVATDFHLAHLGARAAGGAGLVMAEATAVSSEGRISPWDLGLWNDRQQQELARIAALVKSHGAVPAIQLAHAGRKAATDRPWLGGKPLSIAAGGWQPVGASPVSFSAEHQVPDELTVEEIQGVVRAFAEAAGRALAAGFEAVEIHGAHGYLIHSFLSPHSNHRTDAYGGDFAGRSRFALEVVAAVREVWPAELPVLYRASATDWLEGVPSWTVEDTVRLAKELHAAGVDLLDASSAGIDPDAKIAVAPGFQVPFAARIRSEAGLPTGAVGLITEPAQAERIVASGQADVVSLGRELLRDAYWPHRAAAELGAESRWPVQYGYTLRKRG
ncbi:2,4-dienoyl-CoA reductase-like NADH-dependent reductase (Old Yellow Enzyme family) [Kitasatospora gansuensis]|uniref:2,4-dienoyl-CoA reductase-like NADH-dependent reductase (Old Yellow Enzyme family) n=1 Tax=Kitasatospora gansuensis TaxID=258050 RepID=A0A7W7WKG3_9ACTN|nr:NADH:flavin oxidoreductase/NADH oxidase [Kitasatospora gansuensis]MBB4950787.1 2,4-dienoyl-CoA reductase-like NADH-dependent reductase (Old Yellow Enzyme family) [Kitasatospora gansuensis]